MRTARRSGTTRRSGRVPSTALASTGASQGAPGDRLERHAASDRPRPGSWRVAEASRRLSLGCAVARLTLFWRSRRAARLALRSQRAVQTSHGGVAHITRGVGRLGGGRDVQRRRIFMGTPGSAAGARRRLKTSLGAARAARTAARGRAALPPRSRHGLRPGRPRGWRGSDHSTWFGASGGASRHLRLPLHGARVRPSESYR